MEPNRRAVLSSYATHFSPPAKWHIRGVEASNHTSSVIDKVRVDVHSTPFYGLLDRAARLPNPSPSTDRWGNTIGIDDSFYHDRIARVKFSAR